MERIENLINKYERGQIQRIDWLDNLAFRAVEKVVERENSRLGNSHLSLIVDFCSFEHRVAFQVSVTSTSCLIIILIIYMPGACWNRS